MEKLLKLLNQFEKARIDAVNAKGLPYNIKLSFRPYTEEALISKGYKSTQLEICSKYYGFIKWLVDNDKIDRTYRKDLKYPYYIDDKERDLKGYEKSDLLVMLCSIQDNPIEFLISILK